MDERQLARIHRVRTLQLTLARAQEAAAHARVSSEAALSARIAQLAADVAPAPALSGALSLAASAHLRDRLHQSAAAADARVRTAQGEAARAADATMSARRDESAVDKLRARAQAQALHREMRALEDVPGTKRAPLDDA